MDILITLALVFMVWMCIDCMQRKEHFVWIIIMVVLFPVGAVAYYFTVKSKAGNIAGQSILNTVKLKNKPGELETDETLQLKEMIGKFHKPTTMKGLDKRISIKNSMTLPFLSLRRPLNETMNRTEARLWSGKSITCYGELLRSS